MRFNYFFGVLARCPATRRDLDVQASWLRVIPMKKRNKLGTALVVLAIVLFTVPALFPVQAMLTHDTRDSTFDGQEQLEEQGIEIVKYDNLSNQGQELYVQALKNGGEYRISTEQGAPEFDYMSSAECV